MSMAAKFRCLLVEKPEKTATRSLTERSTDDLPAGEVLIRVSWSSLNYKDALSASGHPGVTRKFPHVPGIDAAGTVAESSSTQFKAGDQVLVTGFDLGQNTWGGFGGYVRVPAGWVVPLPAGLTLRESMIYGTAGFTAAMAMEAIQHQGIKPGDGDCLVTGSTGGVGSAAVALLAKAGYRVVAGTGKATAEDYLKSLGAAEAVSRESLVDESNKPLLAGRWMGVVDTVGGNMLGTAIRSCRHDACVTVTGLVGSTDLPMTVYPLILRGITICGIDSAEYPIGRRIKLWERMASDWKPACLETMVAGEVTLDELEAEIQKILAGGVRGRYLIKHEA
jgi:putative YhdH/YhfP family quinone oxidoreductase